MPISFRTGENDKDTVMVVTKGEFKTRSSVTLPPLEEKSCLNLPNGEINWLCPCLNDMATGPCGIEFREAFSCYHHSLAVPRGSDCLKNFQLMEECMMKYPQTYQKQDLHPPVPVPDKKDCKRKFYC